MTYQDQAAGGEFPIYNDQIKTMDFNVRIVKTGDKYGRDLCLTNEGDTLVEFYDAEYDFTQWGQFVSRYYMSTLVEGRNRSEESGLNLDGGIEKWSLTGDQMKSAFVQMFEQLES